YALHCRYCTARCLSSSRTPVRHCTLQPKRECYKSHSSQVQDSARCIIQSHYDFMVCGHSGNSVYFEGISAYRRLLQLESLPEVEWNLAFCTSKARKRR